MRSLLALLLICASPTALGRCAVQPYLVTGSVVDERGAPVQGAMVGVSRVKWASPQGPIVAASDAEGRYSIRLLFDTWSGMSQLGDDCDAQRGKVSVSAFTRTHYALAETVEVGPLRELAVPVLRITQEVQQGSVR
jgi:hypothetical protein